MKKLPFSQKKYNSKCLDRLICQIIKYIFNCENSKKMHISIIKICILCKINISFFSCFYFCFSNARLYSIMRLMSDGYMQLDDFLSLLVHPIPQKGDATFQMCISQKLLEIKNFSFNYIDFFNPNLPINEVFRSMYFSLKFFAMFVSDAFQNSSVIRIEHQKANLIKALKMLL